MWQRQIPQLGGWQRAGQSGHPEAIRHTIAGWDARTRKWRAWNRRGNFLPGSERPWSDGGRHGSYAKLTEAVYRLIWAMLAINLDDTVHAVDRHSSRHHRRHWLIEIRFCRKWAAKLGSEEKQARLLWNWIASGDTIWTQLSLLALRTNRSMEWRDDVTQPSGDLWSKRDHRLMGG